MSAYDIAPLDKGFRAMREKTRPLPPIPDRRGPLVYDRTFTASLNGIQPECVCGADDSFGPTQPAGVADDIASFNG